MCVPSNICVCNTRPTHVQHTSNRAPPRSRSETRAAASTSATTSPPRPSGVKRAARAPRAPTHPHAA
eukprot:383473-Prymnesium_polylepis.1